MFDPSAGERLAPEAFERLFVRDEARIDELYGDLSLDAALDGLEDGAHPALAEEPLDLVLLVEDAASRHDAGGLGSVGLAECHIFVVTPLADQAIAHAPKPTYGGGDRQAIRREVFVRR